MLSSLHRWKSDCLGVVSPRIDALASYPSSLKDELFLVTVGNKMGKHILHFFILTMSWWSIHLAEYT